jgi:hypothetical protein
MCIVVVLLLWNLFTLILVPSLVWIVALLLPLVLEVVVIERLST